MSLLDRHCHCWWLAQGDQGQSESALTAHDLSTEMTDAIPAQYVRFGHMGVSVTADPAQRNDVDRLIKGVEDAWAEVSGGQKSV